MPYHNTARHQSLQSRTERHTIGNNFCLELELPLTLGVLVIGLPLDHSWTGAN